MNDDKTMMLMLERATTTTTANKEDEDRLSSHRHSTVSIDKSTSHSDDAYNQKLVVEYSDDIKRLDTSALTFNCKICLNQFATHYTSTHQNDSSLHPCTSSDADNLNNTCLSSFSYSTQSSAQCGTCNQIFEIGSCKCKFCRNCLSSYIKQSIIDYSVMPLQCPDAKCSAKGQFSNDEIRYLLLGDDLDTGVDMMTLSSRSSRSSGFHDTVSENVNLFNKYLKMCENMEILHNPNKIHCPRPDCQNICSINTVGDRATCELNKPTRVKCDKCLFEFCSLCMKAYKEKPYRSNSSSDETSNPNTDDDDDDDSENDVFVVSSKQLIENDLALNTSIMFEREKKKKNKSNEKLIEKKLKEKFIRSKKHRDQHDSDLECDCCICHCEQRVASNSNATTSNKRYMSLSRVSSTFSSSSSALALNNALYADLPNIKRCPKCNILIERADGCAQVMCKLCKHTFCFYCLTSLDNDFMLKHYTKNGPCKGKLGHSRLSLLFHRFSVVAIFAGTILLIIVMSPFIVLSLPCLLFSRKFRKSCFKLTSKFS